MKSLRYYTICEDIAHQTFIDAFLKHQSKQQKEVEFKFHSPQNIPFKFSNKSDVLNFYAAAAPRLFNIENIDLLFIVVDYDSDDVNEFEAKHISLMEPIKTYQNKTLILLPVQAIEFWFWHIKWKHDNPNSTRNISIDKRNRNEMKIEIYGTKKPKQELSKSKVEEVMQWYEEAWLNSRSKSFRHFLVTFKRYLVKQT